VDESSITASEVVISAY